MIDKFCTYLVERIKGNMQELDEEKELVIDFGVRLIFGELPKIIILIAFGFIFGIGWYTLILFLLLAPYRSFTGGFHLKTHLGCMITTIILYCLPIIIAKLSINFQEIGRYILIGIVGILNLILVKRYAPADTENVPILSEKERKIKRIKAYVTLNVLLIICLFIPDKVVSYMIIYGMFLQILTIVPVAYRLTNNKYGYETYTSEEYK